MYIVLQEQFVDIIGVTRRRKSKDIQYNGQKKKYIVLQEQFVDIIGVTRRRKSKDIQYNGQKKKYKKTN